MAFAIRRHRPVGVELKRIIRKQLTLALDELTGPASGDERTVHEARRRIKKVRATLRLCRDGLGPEFRHINRRMRRASRRLGPIADAEATGRAFDALAAAHPHAIAPAVVTTVRQALRNLLATVDARATATQAVAHVSRRLRQERHHTDQWPIDGDGVELVSAGFARTLRRSRAAMARARAHGSTRRFHAWRRRVKDHWLQRRLLSPRWPDVEDTDIMRLDRLDEVLGQSHDLALLGAALAQGVSLSRAEAAVLLRLVHRETWKCRHASLALGASVYADSEETVVGRLTSAWLPSLDDAAPGRESPPCPRVA